MTFSLWRRPYCVQSVQWLAAKWVVYILFPINKMVVPSTTPKTVWYICFILRSVVLPCWFSEKFLYKNSCMNKDSKFMLYFCILYCSICHIFVLLKWIYSSSKKNNIWSRDSQSIYQHLNDLNLSIALNALH